MDYNDGGGQGGFIANGTGGNGPPELEKWRLETERGMGFRCRIYHLSDTSLSNKYS